MTNDKHLSKKWQRAISRVDIEVEEGQAVCNKHFPESDIIRERTIIGPDGIVLERYVFETFEVKGIE